MKPVFQLLAVLLLNTGLFLVAGCQSPKPSAKAEPPAWATNEIIVTQDGHVTAVKTEPFKDGKQARVTSLESSPFEAYDKQFVAQIKEAWNDLILASHSHLPAEQSGVVVLKFRLNSNGTIDDIIVVKSTANEALVLICETALLGVSPYKPWPDDMLKLVGKNYREITFTFDYQAEKAFDRKTKQY